MDVSQYAEKTCKRYISPVSILPSENITIVVKPESHGLYADALRKIQIGKQILYCSEGYLSKDWSKPKFSTSR